MQIPLGNSSNLTMTYSRNLMYPGIHFADFDEFYIMYTMGTVSILMGISYILPFLIMQPIGESGPPSKERTINPRSPR